MRLSSMGEAAEQLVLALGTLLRCPRQGRLASFGRTVGEHRRYLHDTLRISLGIALEPEGKTVCYARVSSRDEAEHLKAQAARDPERLAAREREVCDSLSERYPSWRRSRRSPQQGRPFALRRQLE
jgi:predicted site-specific integrase-resolvase